MSRRLPSRVGPRFRIGVHESPGVGVLARRVAVAILGIPVVVVLAVRGGPGLVVLVALIAAVASFEFAALARRAGAEPHRALAVFGAAAAPVVASLGRPEAVIAAVSAVAMAAPAASLAFAREGRRPVVDAAVTVGAVAYAGWLPAHLVLLSRLGGRWALYAIVLTWALDTGAFLVGSLLGRHRIAPRISPGKTWEGAAGGMIAAVLTAVALRGWFKGTVDGAEALMVGVAVAAAGILGDLVESQFKRDAGVKDASGLLPGHGGVLDRFDSLFFAGPVVYYLARIVVR